jgi:GDPmannose 4,6-dehydratase
MWQLVNQSNIDTVVIGTGKTFTVKQLCEAAFLTIGEDIIWTGLGTDEKGYNTNGELRVEVSPDLFRPEEVGYLYSDPSLAKKQLNWNPDKITFKYMITEMVKEDILRIEQGRTHEF